MVVFSRPVYFCALAIIVLILDEASQTHIEVFTLYGLPLCTKFTLTYTRDFLLGKGPKLFSVLVALFICYVICITLQSVAYHNIVTMFE